MNYLFLVQFLPCLLPDLFVQIFYKGKPLAEGRVEELKEEPKLWDYKFHRVYAVNLMRDTPLQLEID